MSPHPSHTMSSRTFALVHALVLFSHSTDATCAARSNITFTLIPSSIWATLGAAYAGLILDETIICSGHHLQRSHAIGARQAFAMRARLKSLL